MITVKNRLDDLLGRATMYRLVSVVLGFIAAVAVVLASTERLDPTIFEPGAMMLTLLVLMVASLAASRLCATIWRTTPHLESAVITALLLWFLYWPSTDPTTLAWLAAAAALAHLSKYVIAWRGRHVLNPAAAGAALLVLAGEVLDSVPLTTWWAASEALFPFVLVGAGLVLYRTGRFELAAVFAVLAAVLTYWGVSGFISDTGDALSFVVYSTPIVFFAGFMLSEPLTLPPRRRQQVAVAAVAAVVFTWPLFSQRVLDDPFALGPFEGTYELALVVANVIAFGLGQRGGLRLDVREVRPLAGDVWEIVFEPQRPVRFVAGQYLELDLPHPGADRRGSRRMFTISSPPGAATVTVAVRVPEVSSSFKQALLALEPGTVVTATGVHGDFVWPDAGRPVVLVAGGIGVTPFLSQLRADRDRDAVLVYGVPDADEVPYRDELVDVGARVVLVAPAPPADLPEGWRHVPAPFVTGDTVADAVPDLASRSAFVSGPPAMVDAVRQSLRRRCAAVHTDHFTGY
ncbi:oxidoreductase NAD-binding domain protein [Aeromicrobium marinum DSM 15272]|uniref:Oxidoreductase NAD-binding domain protein n=1 Tax=Aeromicrobium marinum DSM 15272 TaxID=585531 RepID=E2SFA8_9ACTN|nr:FAD-dependent oxidoreductase [Aeromicrobium marinum]EFQ82193.1 oxidoreductase NAD-binding domain protein [Aeromicrobium marinum DSM 15272]